MDKNNKLKTNKCRTCFNGSKGFKSLSKLRNDGKQQSISYAGMLKKIVNIDVMDRKFEDLPQYICNCCCRKLKMAHTYVQQAQEVNDKLWSMISEKNLDKQSDCLQEIQIDLESCIEIKIENINNEGPVEDKLRNVIPPTDGLDDDVSNDDNKTKNLNSINEIKIMEMISLKNSTQQKLKDDQEPFLNTKESNSTKTKQIERIPIKNSIDSECSNPDVNSSESDTDIFKPNIEMSDSNYNDGDDDDDESLHSTGSNWHHNENTSNRKNEKNKDFSNKSEKSENENIDIAVPCDKCNKIFVNSKALAIHQRISHIPEEQKCTCTICGKKFTRYCNMYKHMRTFHGPESVTLIRKPPEGENVYKCDKCSKKYTRKKSLSHHIKIKHLNPPKRKDIDKSTKSIEDEKKRSDKGSLCPICGSSFTSKTQLTVHIRRHTGERPFKCDLCERAFLLATHLTSHKRLHTGEKPFKCQLCGKAFRVSGKLAQHMRSHSDIRPYKCSQCERSFKYSQDLNIHMRSHTGERPYCCGVCGSTFQRHNTLRDHRMRSGHTENTIQAETEILENLPS